MPLGLSENLFQRIVSALSLLPVVLGLIYLGGWWFFALLIVGAWFMYREWCELTNVLQSPLRIIGLIAIISPTALVTSNYLEIGTSVLVPFLLGIGFVLLALPPKRLAAENTTGRSTANAFAGVCYVSFAVVSMAWLREQDTHGLLVIWLFFAVWAMDVGGYFAGKGIGGPKLAPKISPKKTWAGLIGGMVLAALVSLAISLIFEFGDPAIMPILGAVVAFIAQVGDLYESAVKRALDKKDSGALIPGHGGILDRVDGLVFAAPFVAIGMNMPALSWS